MNSAFESLYSKLILRDLLGRALPGTILFIFVFNFDGQTFLFQTDLDGSDWLILSVTGYLFMHLLTYLGGKFGLINLFVWDKPGSGEIQKSIQYMIQFLTNAKDNPELVKERERIVVFKTLFGGIFLGQSLAILVGILYYRIWIFVFGFVVAYLFRRLHLHFVVEQRCLEAKVVEGIKTNC